MAKEKLFSNFFRIDGKNSFMELLPFAFAIGKLQINFVQYDEVSKKQTRKLECYLSIEEALTFSNLILSGRLDRIIKEAKTTGKFEEKEVNDYTSYYTVMGGIVYDNKPDRFKADKEKHPWLNSQNDSISRQFKVLVSNKYKYVLRCEYGIGKRNEKGLIVPQGKTQEYIQIPLSEYDAIAMAKSIEMNIQGYINMFYLRFSEKMFPKLDCKLFEADPNYYGNTGNATAQEQTAPANQNTPNKPVAQSNASATQNNSSAPQEAPTTSKVGCYTVLTTGVMQEFTKHPNHYGVRVLTEDGKPAIVQFVPSDFEKFKNWEQFKKRLMNETGVRFRANFAITEKENDIKLVCKRLDDNITCKVEKKSKLTQVNENLYSIKVKVNNVEKTMFIAKPEYEKYNGWESMKGYLESDKTYTFTISAIESDTENAIYFVSRIA